MRNDPDARVRQDAAAALAQYANSARSDGVPDHGAAEAALSADAPVSEDDPTSLLEALDPKKPEHLARLKQYARLDPHVEVRSSALWRVAQGGPQPDVLDTLIGALQGDPEAIVRDNAARILSVHSWCGQPGVKDALEKAAKDDPSEEVRKSAQIGLARIANPED